ncbi:MAG: triose-phosphate isomerase [Fimbriimonadaceae bacterium]|nr:triose-phosphate isomerase [Alphaproteobacteria bacterium]
MAGIRALVAGNWKMNGLGASLAMLDELAAGLKSAGKKAGAAACDVMICPPATLLSSASARVKGADIGIGGQDCHAEISGAHTGDISAEMLADAGAGAVIVGHSERRADHGESDDDVRAKAMAAHRAGLMAIICIGETEAERQAGQALEVVSSQLKGSLPTGGVNAKNTIIAYEPVWAIGTGLTPTAIDVAEVHGTIRADLRAILGETGADMRILYGGSVKAGNAEELMGVANVNGALVGGASLKAEDFLGIIAAYR